jgi:6-phosphogluconolactonase
MTLTFPVINRARHILWVVTGAEKAEMLTRLRNADASIPAGRVSLQDAMVLADSAAAGVQGAAKDKSSAARQAT